MIIGPAGTRAKWGIASYSLTLNNPFARWRPTGWQAGGRREPIAKGRAASTRLLIPRRCVCALGNSWRISHWDWLGSDLCTPCTFSAGVSLRRFHSPSIMSGNAITRSRFAAISFARISSVSTRILSPVSMFVGRSPVS